MPKKDRPLMLPYSELAEILHAGEQQAEEDPLAALEEKLLLEELIAELPEPQHSYVRERLAGVTVEEIAERAGWSKSTVSDGLTRRHHARARWGTRQVREPDVSILEIVRWAISAIIAFLALLLETFFS
ncbi:hypothetical protein [Streptomyces rhizosphaericus]|uniref:Uncharacterized protein n=1 Tax=Streptomyces rhizosphaericus TaxID=114699 RepID=A0A6G4APQ2_9ACTN|nr:hypothetical protein [Streptomyces rhizosphaericus]NEW75373.1 hypothetical protein [Streptomyces rhizosphaericus]